MNNKDVEKKACELLDKYDLPATAYTDVFDIARKLGFLILAKNMEDSGQIIISDELREKFRTNKIIAVNKTHSPTRIRFTVAHELGHYILHAEGDKKYFALRESQVYQYSQREHEANVFASALLLPKESVESYVNKFGRNRDRDSIIEYIAEVFHVSFFATKYRLINLGLIRGDHDGR